MPIEDSLTLAWEIENQPRTYINCESLDKARAVYTVMRSLKLDPHVRV